MSLIDEPITRQEMYLSYLNGNTDITLPQPITRLERYLYYLCLNGAGSEGGGGSGTTNYNNLQNKPSINNVELVGNITTDELGIQDGQDGLPGKDGTPGANGKDGQNGKDGKSAYEYAKEGGFTGNETQFSFYLANMVVFMEKYLAGDILDSDLQKIFDASGNSLVGIGTLA